MLNQNPADALGRRKRSRLQLVGQLIEEARLRLFVPLLVNLPGVIQRSIVVESAPTLCNPSIIRWKDGWLIVARQPNYLLDASSRVVVEGGWKQLYSQNWLILCDDNLHIREAKLLKNSRDLSDCDSCRNGLEDPRIVAVSDRVYGMWSGLEVEVTTADGRGPAKVGSDPLPQEFYAKNTMLAAEISDGTIKDPILLPSPHSLSIEKNWMPVAIDENLFVVYSLHTMEVYRLGRSGLERVHKAEEPSKIWAGWSGSSQLIEWDGNFICVAHSRRQLFRRIFGNVGKLYTHRLVMISPDWKILARSSEFCFQSRGIEFCAGIAKDGDRVVFSYGINDCAAATLEISRQQVNELLRPI